MARAERATAVSPLTVTEMPNWSLVSGSLAVSLACSFKEAIASRANWLRICAQSVAVRPAGTCVVAWAVGRGAAVDKQMVREAGHDGG